MGPKTVRDVILAGYVLVAGCWLTFTAARAAMVEPVQGEVYVDVGEGFRRILEPTPVADGMRVYVREAALAWIHYSETCVHQALPETVLFVAHDRHCPMAVLPQTASGVSAATPPGSPGSLGPLGPPLSVTPAPTAGVDPVAIGLAAAIAAGAAALALSAGGQGEADPISP